MEKFISDYEQACAKLGRSTAMPDVSSWPEEKHKSLIAQHVLETIIEANNEKWKANIADTNQLKWYPIHRVIEDKESPLGFRLSFVASRCDDGSSFLGARLACCSEELADFTGREHEELYRDLRA